ncbi:MAG: BMP family ABC transporter substrate-binding protein, partial [Lachnospiraceae bacterium]|nr:BMP family ABC transporter substrate-binding protein [Lachnospiraceae bacterium]
MKHWKRMLAVLLCGCLMTGCGSSKGEPDDYATNEGTTDTADSTTTESGGVAKDEIKVGVLYLSDPDEGSGYSYTHDLGIKGMQENLGLKDDQIDRKIVDDTDAPGTEKAIEECVADGCNII